MRISRLLTLVFSAFLAFAQAQSIHYNLKMEKPENHYFQVEMILSDLTQKELTVKMPIWAPGSYLAREFSKNLDMVKAFDEKNKPLSIEKTSKNAWKVQTNEAKTVRLAYEVYSFELTVRTSFLDFTHGFVSGSGVFMYLDGQKEKPGTLEVFPHADFKKITTALPVKAEGETKDGSKTFKFNNYDQLVDCPIEIGNQVEFSFMAAGVKHNVGVYGRGNFEVEKLKVDMARIIETATKVFDENPNKEYTFIIHNVEDGQGGLEHMNSTTLSVNRWTYQGSDYVGFLSLVAHEYFHLWNVKRIRPIELGPFNYDQENYTTLLWVMEGFTSYYDELLMLRAGYYSQDQYISKLNGTMNYVEGSVGARVQPLSHSSYDAWIKAYRPNENSSNTTMTYYSRGQLMASIFDAMIVYESKGKMCLDDFMQLLYNKFYKKMNRGFTEIEFKAELEKMVNQDLTDFFKNYIYGTEIPDYKVYFSRVGVDVEDVTTNEPSFGARYSDNGGQLIVRNVRRNSSAENAGLSVNDEIIAEDGVRVNSNALTELISGLKETDQMNLLVSRDNILFELTVTMSNYAQPRFKLSPMSNSAAKLLRDYWLR